MFYLMDKIASEKYFLFLTTIAKIMRVSWGALFGYYLWGGSSLAGIFLFWGLVCLCVIDPIIRAI